MKAPMLLLLPVALWGIPACEGRTQGDPAPAVAPAVLAVHALVGDPDAHRSGPIALEGVVSAVSPSEGTLSLIDRREFEACGLGCAERVLPIRWAGPLPEPGAVVRVEGEIQDATSGLVFVARTLERAP